jgi:RNA polymerase sigma-70 factor, ECF subfamily
MRTVNHRRAGCYILDEMQHGSREHDDTADRKLAQAASQGDETAFRRLFDRLGPRVLAFALRLTGCRADAEDLTAETFTAAYRSLPEYRGGARVLTWLLGITLRRFRDNNRRTRPTLVLLDADREVAAPRHENGVLNRLALETALACLDAPLRDAFILVAVQGRTHREAAELLDTPIGTVKWRVAEATKRLRVALTEADAAPGTDIETSYEEKRHVRPLRNG